MQINNFFPVSEIFENTLEGEENPQEKYNRLVTDLCRTALSNIQSGDIDSYTSLEEEYRIFFRRGIACPLIEELLECINDSQRRTEIEQRIVKICISWLEPGQNS